MYSNIFIKRKYSFFVHTKINTLTIKHSNSYPFRAYANLRQSSLDGLTGRGGSAFSAGAFTRPRPSSSETNLRKLAMGDQFNRPGSALGLLQGLYTTRFIWNVTWLRIHFVIFYLKSGVQNRSWWWDIGYLKYSYIII